MLRVLDLFSGIGGFSLGLERADGFRTVAFCEIEKFPRRVLAKHWPEVPVYDDVRTLTADRLAADGIGVDIICGGFPCQDISCAGKGAGIAGERSGLWREYARLIGELVPRYVIVENVAALLGRGLDAVLGDMAALGFDAEWHCIPASAVGAPHRRDRIWVVGYPAGEGSFPGSFAGIHRGEARPGAWNAQSQRRGGDVAHPASDGWQQGQFASAALGHGSITSPARGAVADAAINRRQSRRQGDAKEGARRRDTHRGAIGPNLPHTHKPRLAFGQSLARHNGEEQQATVGANWWITEPDVGRVAHGVPARVDRLRGLGNAVVPQIPELIGRAILASMEARDD